MKVNVINAATQQVFTITNITGYEVFIQYGKFYIRFYVTDLDNQIDRTSTWNLEEYTIEIKSMVTPYVNK